MHDNIDPYSPCFCGSGKKYRFCCQRKNKNTPAQAAPQEAPLVIGDMEECERLHVKGLEYMKRGKFEQAISWFTKALKADKTVSNPANNLALCLFFTGKHEEAIRVQRQSLEDSPFPNPFGYANLSLFLLFLGDEEGAEDAVSFAAGLKALNAEATIKVCETLARLRRHGDILAAADASDFGRDPYVRFYTGVAAANLGDRKRAIQDLSGIPIGHVKATMAQQYLQHLKNKTQPNTVRKDWPYLLPEEFYIGTQISKDEDLAKALMSRRYMVDFAEAMLNAKPDATDDAVKLLEFCEHPEATALLWLILKGTFGPDHLRLHAARILTEKGEMQRGEEFELINNGQSTKQQLFSICLNPEFTFSEMPPGIEKRYKKLILEGRKTFANWSQIVLGYQKLLPEAPHYYPIRYNYAVSLVHCQRDMEAESILRSLVADYPEYLFARSTLLTILVHANRLAEAEKLVKATNFPKETHPDAYVAWLVSMVVYRETIGENSAAFMAIRAAHDIAPGNAHVAMLWSHWKDYDEAKGFSTR